MKRLIFIAISLLAMVSCTPERQSGDIADFDGTFLIHELNDTLLETVVQDGFPPPVASRLYAYPQIAAYEVIIHKAPDTYQSFVGQLNEFEELTQPKQDSLYNYEIAMVQAFNDVANHLTYRDYIVQKKKDNLLKMLANKLGDQEIYDRSVAYGAEVAKDIIAWANTDGYNRTRNAPKWVVTDSLGSWEPTPPKYGEAIEPHWQTLRPFVMDSTNQFRRPNPIAFSTDSTSEFYKEAYKIYEIANKATEEQLVIAKFWDCNPTPSVIDGHLMVTNRQNSPPGHWMGITKIAAKQENLNLIESCEVYALASIAFADGFKSAWDTKYATNLIRPETYINKYIDPDWKPKLETPLFPEYTSAHSLISAVTAHVLTDYFGDDFEYTDSTNVPFKLPARSFTSFKQAADEAAYSRVYGGIHYLNGCMDAKAQGEELGELIVERVNTRK